LIFIFLSGVLPDNAGITIIAFIRYFRRQRSRHASMIAEGSVLLNKRDCGRVPLNAVHVVRHTLIITPASS